MDVALLIISVFSLCFAISGIIMVRYALRELDRSITDYKAKSKEMSEAAIALGNLHNDHAARVKSQGERLEVLELRYNGINPAGAKRSF